MRRGNGGARLTCITNVTSPLLIRRIQRQLVVRRHNADADKIIRGLGMPEPLRGAAQADLHVEVKVDEEVLRVDGRGVDGVRRDEVDAATREGQEEPHGGQEEARRRRRQRLADRHVLLEDQVVLDAEQLLDVGGVYRPVAGGRDLLRPGRDLRLRRRPDGGRLVAEQVLRRGEGRVRRRSGYVFRAAVDEGGVGLLLEVFPDAGKVDLRLDAQAR